MYRSIHDPRDPWAWRDQWTGEARTDYAELWIIIPLVLGLVLLAIAMLIPLFIYKYCRKACPCQSWCVFFDEFLRTLHEIGREKDLGSHPPQTQPPTHFDNPAYVEQQRMTTFPAWNAHRNWKFGRARRSRLNPTLPKKKLRLKIPKINLK